MTEMEEMMNLWRFLEIAAWLLDPTIRVESTYRYYVQIVHLQRRDILHKKCSHPYRSPYLVKGILVIGLIASEAHVCDGPNFSPTKS